jgi:hypothetical protein
MRIVPRVAWALAMDVSSRRELPAGDDAGFKAAPGISPAPAQSSAARVPWRSRRRAPERPCHVLSVASTPSAPAVASTSVG